MGGNLAALHHKVCVLQMHATLPYNGVLKCELPLRHFRVLATATSQSSVLSISLCYYASSIMIGPEIFHVRDILVLPPQFIFSL